MCFRERYGGIRERIHSIFVVEWAEWTSTSCPIKKHYDPHYDKLRVSLPEIPERKPVNHSRATQTLPPAPHVPPLIVARGFTWLTRPLCMDHIIT